MVLPAIDLAQVRPHRGDQRLGFEELIRQLVPAEYPNGTSKIENRGLGKDGGVEVLVRLGDGTCIGWQAKFVPQFGPTQAKNLKASFQSALQHYGEDNSCGISKYIVAFPFNLDGSGRSRADDSRKRWTDFLQWAAKEADARLGRRLAVELWDETTLISMLMKPAAPYPGIRAYFFRQSEFGDDWFRDQVDRTIAALDERYHPEDHVNVDSARVFDVVYRRPNVRADIQKDFAAVERIYPISKEILGSASPRPSDEAIAMTNEALSCFLELKARVDVPFDKSWPIAEWHSTWDRAARMAWQLYQDWSSLVRSRGDDNKKGYEDKLWSHLWIETHTREVFSGPWHRLLDADIRKAILFVGEAGSGKSHLLARQADLAAQGKLPVVFLLGQDFVGRDVRTAILQHLDLRDISFAEFLGALQSASAARQTRGLIVIDALNESDGGAFWRDELLRLAKEISHYPNLVFVASCRIEYRDLVVPKSASDMFVCIEVPGFRSAEEREQACRTYMDRRGIVRPIGPFLDPEFRNPLFLRITCETLVRAGKNSYPRGLRGMRSIFQFVLDQRGRYLGTPRDGSDDLVGPLWRALTALAKTMAESRLDHVPLSVAGAIVSHEFTPYSPPDGLTWLDVLRRNGLVRKDLLPSPIDDTVLPEDVIRFTFQRLSDYLMAEALLPPPGQIQSAFDLNGPLGFLRAKVHYEPISSKKSLSENVPLGTTSANQRAVFGFKQKWRGLVIALWIGFAEKYGAELTDLASFSESAVGLPVAWMNVDHELADSIRWRDSSAVTGRTHELAVALLDFEYRRFPLYLELALIPNHPLNAKNLLHTNFCKIPMPTRDALMAKVFLRDYSESLSVAGEIIDWSLHADLKSVESTTLEQIVVALGWFCSSSNRRLRDRSTKALSAVFVAHPAIITTAISYFGRVDDDYIRERLFAAAYGAMLFIRTSADLAAVALATWNLIFDVPDVTRHIALRSYARGLIELASARGSLPPGIDVKRCRPPYQSPAICKWPTLEEVDQACRDSGANDVFRSVIGYREKDGQVTMAGDFARYVMWSVDGSFSIITQRSGRPRPLSKEKADFWARVRSLNPAAAEAADALLAASETRTVVQRLSWLCHLPHDRRRIDKRTAQAKLKANATDVEHRFIEAEKNLLRVLPRDLKQVYESESQIPAAGDEQIEPFPSLRGRCWVAQRVLDLGWSRNLFGQTDDQRPSYDQDKHTLERVGKKYQWIAFSEFAGYLVDHHWYLSNDKSGVASFDRLDEFDRLDMDPSFLLSADDPPPTVVAPWISLPPETNLDASDAEGAAAWTANFENIVDPKTFIIAGYREGAAWWLARSFKQDLGYYDKLRGNAPFRTTQWSVTLVIVRQDDFASLLNRFRGRSAVDLDLTEPSWAMRRLFGEQAFDTGVSKATLDNELRSSGDDEPIQFSVASRRIDTVRGEYDESASAKLSLSVPSSLLVNGMRLRPISPRDPTFVSEHGQLAWLSLRAEKAASDDVFINGSLLQTFLASAGLLPVWVSWGEKDGGLGRGPHYERRNGPYSRTVFSGAAWFADGHLTSEHWFVSTPILPEAESESMSGVPISDTASERRPGKRARLTRRTPKSSDS
jgi:hypothetical protein